jgi:hypothetical protein
VQIKQRQWKKKFQVIETFLGHSNPGDRILLDRAHSASGIVLRGHGSKCEKALNCFAFVRASSGEQCCFRKRMTINLGARSRGQA